MFPLKRKGDGGLGKDPVVQKKGKIYNPIQQEKYIEELQPIQSLLDSKIEEWTRVQGENIRMDPLLSSEQRTARLHAMEFHANINKYTEFLTNEKKEFTIGYLHVNSTKTRSYNVH